MSQLIPTEGKRISFSVVAFASGAFLIPWTFFLFESLPDRTIVHNWDLAWTGFDIALTIVLLSTALAALKRSNWTMALAPICATMLIVDAWFDITTATHSDDLKRSILTAVLGELPLAIVCIAATIFAHAAIFDRNNPDAAKPTLLKEE